MYIIKEKISAEKIKAKHTYLDCGGIVTFEGAVRNHHEGKAVKYLNYESYASMAEKVMPKLLKEISAKYPGCHIDARHRIGELALGDVAVAIVAWAPHRKEAFLACEEMINRIKKELPVWKQEFYEDGSVAWVRCHHAA